tara:strand:+ start:441 stop:605 length:165 start_codon:yes stop_codon:yes gene_type:complete
LQGKALLPLAIDELSKKWMLPVGQVRTLQVRQAPVLRQALEQAQVLPLSLRLSS